MFINKIAMIEGDSMNVKKPMVSISMITYNHEKYIRQALDSILMQKVNFEYEIVIGEDCSKDNTRNILLEYKELYPDRIKLILHDKNVGMKMNGNSVRRMCVGKYRASCEGDDYWTDPLKLQKQIDFLESNPDFIAITHDVEIVDDDGNLIDGFNKKMYCKDEVYTIKHAELGLLPGQSASRVYRNVLIEDLNALNLLEDCNANGDMKLALYLVLNGKVFCSKEIMSHHRWVKSKGDSWTAKTHNKNMMLFYFVSYKSLEKLAYALKKEHMDYRKIYLNLAYSAFICYVKKPTKENKYIATRIFSQIENKNQLLAYTFYKLIRYPYDKFCSCINRIRC